MSTVYDFNKTGNLQTTLCLKNVPTLKLSVAWSDLYRFLKFLHCWKAYEICYKTRSTIPASL